MYDYDSDPYEVIARWIADNLFAGFDAYTRRAQSHGFATYSNSARLVAHLTKMLEKRPEIRRLVLAAVARANGRHRDVISAMKEVLLDVMGTERPIFVGVSLRGLARGTLRAKAGRVLVAAARRTNDPYFDFNESTRTARQVRGMEELLGTVPQSWKLEHYVAILKRGPVAFLKQVILEQVQLEEPPELIPWLPGGSRAAINWELVPLAIESSERASKIPSAWTQAIRWLETGIHIDAIARSIFWDEVSFGEAEVGDFDEVFVAGVEAELEAILVEHLRLDRGEGKYETDGDRDAE